MYIVSYCTCKKVPECLGIWYLGALVFTVQCPNQTEDEVQDVAVEQRGLGAEEHTKDLWSRK